MNKIKIVSVLVKDYDEAIGFYREKLGFELLEDAPFGDRRWVTLALPNQKDVTIALELAKTDDDLALVGKQGGSFAFLGMDTTDCIGDYNRMKGLNVKFQGEPTSGPWGTGVLLEDLYGNKIFMSQEPQIGG
jgi:catechol 2,3-dioxygenase-like lactoylglutathione lyase family enzyme